MKISPQDQRLTDYVLNELDPAERAEVEQLLAHDPAARQEVEELRRTSAWLTEGLKLQPGLSLSEEERAEVLESPRAKIIPFPSARTILSIAAVVSVAAFSTKLLLSSVGTRQTPVFSTVNSKLDSANSGAEVDSAEPEARRSPSSAPKDLLGGDIKENSEPPATVTTGPVEPTRPHGREASLEEVIKAQEPYVETAKKGVALSGYVDTSAAYTFGGGKQVPNSSAAPTVEQKPASTSTPARLASSKLEATRWSPPSAAAPTVVLSKNGKFEGYVEYGSPISGTGDDLSDATRQRQAGNTESYSRIHDNPFRRVTDEALSTFSIDVDTASYANVRSFLAGGQLPPPDAVRIEEMVNYFTYDYPQPQGDVPFSANVEIASAPWESTHRLVRIGLKGRDIAPEKRPAGNLVFLLDVSGSMNEPNKLPLVKKGMHLLVDQLNEDDRVAIAVYAGSSGTALPSTSCSEKKKIHAAIDRLQSGGSTNGAEGIHLAYDLAKENFISGGTNRVILCTDGDFNVGVTDEGQLTRLIEQKAKSKIFLSVLGFGMGNLKDSTLEKLADKGNGNYAYIDTLREAKKVLVNQMNGTLITIAKDVKIQVEFNPAQVQAYRLIGYENRMLAAQDFNDDKKDAGEIGAGHMVTALYEIVPVGVEINLPGVDPLKYQKPSPSLVTTGSSEMLTLKLRYKAPEGDTSKLLTVPIKDEGQSFGRASADFKFAASVAGFGMILRGSPHKGSASLENILEWANEGRGKDTQEYRSEFIDLVKKARGLSSRE